MYAEVTPLAKDQLFFPATCHLDTKAPRQMGMTCINLLGIEDTAIQCKLEILGGENPYADTENVLPG